MSHRLVSAYAVRLVDVDVSWVAAVPRPLRRVERFRGIVTTEGNSRPVFWPPEKKGGIDRRTTDGVTPPRGVQGAATVPKATPTGPGSFRGELDGRSPVVAELARGGLE